jgi:radical SAM superfamily enzyme YgiQ (UPF0313 family)
MKILLIYPYSKKLVTGCNPPLALMYLGSSLLKAGYKVKIIDIDGIYQSNLTPADALNIIKEYSPALIGIPLFSQGLTTAYRVIEILKEELPKCRIVLGGHHATVRPGETLEQFPKCDYIIRGEAEESIVKLASFIEKGGAIESISGLSYRKDNKIFHNPESIIQDNLDNILLPDRGLLESYYQNGTYWRIGHRGTTDIIITSRGCPFQCKFCFKLTKGYRTRSPENVMEEIYDILSKGIKSIHILDDNFTLDRERCFKILDIIEKERLNITLKVRSRVHNVDEKLLKKMKKAGVCAVVYGFESGSQKVLDCMKKGTTVEMNYRAIKLTKKVGLQCYADMILGYPGETPQTIEETEKFILTAKPHGVNMSVLYPLPGTAVYDEAKENGSLVGDWRVNAPEPWVKLPWVREKATLELYLKRILKRYYSNPVVIFNILRNNLLCFSPNQIKLLFQHYFQTVFYKTN